MTEIPGAGGPPPGEGDGDEEPELGFEDFEAELSEAGLDTADDTMDSPWIDYDQEFFDESRGPLLDRLAEDGVLPAADLDMLHEIDFRAAADSFGFEFSEDFDKLDPDTELAARFTMTVIAARNFAVNILSDVSPERNTDYAYEDMLSAVDRMAGRYFQRQIPEGENQDAYLAAANPAMREMRAQLLLSATESLGVPRFIDAESEPDEMLDQFDLWADAENVGNELLREYGEEVKRRQADLAAMYEEEFGASDAAQGTARDVVSRYGSMLWVKSGIEEEFDKEMAKAVADLSSRPGQNVPTERLEEDLEAAVGVNAEMNSRYGIGN